MNYGHDAVGSPGSSGYFSANTSTRPPTAASRATGSKPLPSCSLVILNRVPNSSTSKGHDPQAQRYYGSATVSGPGPTTSNVHQSRQCKLPGCRKAAIFDPSINEQREFCEDHIKYALRPPLRARRLLVMSLSSHVIPDGFAGRCAMCKKMPARLDSEFCSDACRSMSEHMGIPSTITGNTGHQYQQQPPSTTRQPAPHMQRAPSNGGSGAAVGVPHTSRRPAENSVPEGLVPTCQECRRPIMKESRTGSLFCGRNCEEAYRKYSSSSSSSKSRR